MPLFHVSATLTVDVVLTIEASEHSRVHHIIKDHLAVSASLIDVNNAHTIIEESITDIDDITVAKHN